MRYAKKKQLFEEVKAYYESLKMKTDSNGKRYSQSTMRQMASEYIIGKEHSNSILDGSVAAKLCARLRGENKKQSTNNLETAMRSADVLDTEEKWAVSIDFE